jgi:AcrR family transcriptional regulator
MSGRAARLTERDAIDVKESRRRAIVTAAAKCFETYGVQRTRVEDVANAAGISGTNFYHFFRSRSALIDAVVLARVRAIVDAAAPVIEQAASLGEALADVMACTIDGCQRDPLFMELLGLTRQKRLGELGGEPSAFGYDMLERLWLPVLVRARDAGELRPDLTDDAETMAWLGRVSVILLLSQHNSEEHVRRTVRLYVAPALTAP